MMTTPANREKAELRQEIFTRDNLPYARMIDAETVETKSGHLLQVIELEGINAETLSDREINYHKHIRNALLKSLTDSSTSLYFHTIRKKYTAHMEGIHSISFSKELDRKWQAKLLEKRLFINKHYMTVVKKPPVGKIRKLSDLYHSLSNAMNQEARNYYRKKAHKDLNNITDKIINHLSEYKTKKLSNYSHRQLSINFSEILTFLGELINLEEKRTISPTGDLSAYLAFKRIFFDKKSGKIALRGIDNASVFAALISIDDYEKSTAAGMLDHVLNIKSELVISQAFTFLDKRHAKKMMDTELRNQVQSEDATQSGAVQLVEAIDDLNSSDVSYGEHYFSILCKEDSIESLEKSVLRVDSALNEIGIIAKREDVGIKSEFFAMLPANHAYISRKRSISSKNMAAFASLHNYPQGKKSDNFWGEAITVLETISGTPFHFSFHQMDVGNTFFIGSMGSGKTLVEGFLLSLSMKLGGRKITFDYERGLELLIRAEGGNYSRMNAGQRTGFAPFQMEDTINNRYFLSQLMQKIARKNNQPLTDSDMERIKECVTGAFSLSLEDRVLRNIVPFLGMKKSGSLRSRFESWVNEGDYAWVIDNEIDTLSLDSMNIGFDMTAILNDPYVRDIVYFYLFHRTEMLLDGTRTRIVVAEGWKALQDEEFSRQFNEWNSTLRKKEAFLVLDTQSPDDIALTSIGSKMIQETPTKICFANPLASYDTYVHQFGFTPKEFEIIRSLDKESFFFLLKQGKTSVVARIDLSGMDDEIALLSGRNKSLKIFDSIIDRVGDDVADWLPVYLKEIKEAKGKL